MALLFHDSFDDRISYPGYGDKYDVSDSSYMLELDPGRTGKAAEFGGNFLRKVFAPRATYIVGFAHLMSRNDAGAIRIFSLYDGGTRQLYLRRDGGSASTLSVVRGDNVALGTTTDTLEWNLWAFIELKATIGNSGSFELRANGKTILTGSRATPWRRTRRRRRSCMRPSAD